MHITITGKSGSGKSSIAKYLTSIDERFIYLDIDTVGHIILEEEEIAKKVSKEFKIPLNEKKQIDRKILGSIVLNDEEKMKRYSDITWSLMEQTIDKFIKNNKDKIVILDWILIPKTKYFKESIFNILVTSDLEERKKRAILRDHITEEKFMERENASIEFDESQFDFILENKNFNKTKGLVKKIYDKSINTW